MENILEKKDNDLIYWNALALFPKFDAKRLKKIIDLFPNAELAFKTTTSNYLKIGFEENLIQEFFEFRKKIEPEKEWEKLTKEKIKIITIKNENYPNLLKEIDNPPPLLYCQGEVKREETLPLAVVGTRKMTFYGRGVCEELIKNLVRNNITIVSGLALGIDGLTHKRTLKEKGRTIAVLGGGIDKNTIYPKVNKDLAKKIVDNGGAIISEYPYGFSPTKYTFPARNRIISGLSIGTLVIEAPMESGAMITAKFALEQNREVFAVPGNIYSKNSMGCNWLIKLGARPVTRAEDILEAFGINIDMQKKRIVANNPEEETLLECLASEPIHINQLIKQSNLDSAKVISTLSLMEISGKVKNLGNDNYILNY